MCVMMTSSKLHQIFSRLPVRNGMISLGVVTNLVFVLTVIVFTHTKIIRVGEHFSAFFSIIDTNGRVMKNFIGNFSEVSTAEDCVARCIKDKRCQTFNYNCEKRICEVLSVSKYDGVDYLEYHRGWTHYETDCNQNKIGPFCNAYNLCKDYEVCEDAFNETLYVCRCREGFSGKNCANYSGPGSNENNPAVSCLLLFGRYTSLPGGYYWLKEEGQVEKKYCKKKGGNCIWKDGDGDGKYEIEIGKTSKQGCADACLRIGKIRINGATTDTTGNCWCEILMKNIKKSDVYQSCILDEDGSCAWRDGDGDGKVEILMGKMSKQGCVEACTSEMKHKLKINGAIFKTASGLCSCEVLMKKITDSVDYQTCFLDEPADSSCVSIKEANPLAETGMYWINPSKPVYVYCDMTTDGGGWMLIANVTIKQNVPIGEIKNIIAESPISNNIHDLAKAENQTFRLNPAKLKDFSTAFNQLRFYCHRQNRTVHLRTLKNDLGKSVWDYFTMRTDTMPQACNSFNRYPDDNSVLATSCARWSWDANNYTGNWGWKGASRKGRIYELPFYTDSELHFGMGADRILCDSSYGSRDVGDWKIFVR